MNLRQELLIQNDCYKQGRVMVPRGVMIHSTAAPGVRAAAWPPRWNKPGVEKAVHAFIDDAEAVQTLPWTARGWHAGASANNTHIGLELCEPAGHGYQGSTMTGYDAAAQQAYFDAVWDKAAELTAQLCSLFGLDPLTGVVCHCEGYRRGIASNHADVMHWFPKHGRTMDDFRADVAGRLAKGAGDLTDGQNPGAVKRPVLRRGSKGDAVRELQARLLAAGCTLPKYGADGSFGPETETAVRTFQKASKLVLDGVCGPKTWAALLS